MLVAGLAADVRFAVAGLLAAGVVIAWFAVRADIRSLRLPNPLCAAVFAAGVSAGVIEGSWRGAFGGAVLAAVPFGVIHAAGPRSLGFGDVKFAGALGSLVGVLWWPATLVMGSAAFVSMSLVRVRVRTGPVPAGPSVFVGALCGLGLSIGLRARGMV